jgi:hypothetical protein
MDEDLYTIETSIEGIRIIHQGLSLALKHWSGGDPQEQIELIAIKNQFYRMILEYQYDSM